MEKYKDYSVEDFIEDDSFVRWVRFPDKQSQAFWSDFVAVNPDQREKIEEAVQFLKIFDERGSELAPARLADLQRLINDRIDEPVSATTVHKIMSSRSRKNRTYLLAAAVTITLLSLISWSVLHMYDQEVSTPIHAVQQEYSTNHLQEHIIPRGKRSRITLGDGTLVWINANSTLEYSKDFLSHPTRDVYLRGEAYFDVVPDKEHPFIVHVQDVEVRVLGTSFNIKGYDGEPSIEATLVHGQIAIAGDSAYDKVNLSANQRAVILKGTKELLVENNVETETYTSWRKGVLVFNDEPLYEIFPILERTFNVTIHTGDATALDCRFTATISNKSLNEVLELFRTSDKISYTIVANDVYIKGRFCEESEL